MIRYIQAAQEETGAAFPKEEIGEIARQTGLPELLCRVLYSRGIQTAAAAGEFLACDLKALHDPFLFKNMDKAVARICDALDKNERIMVYGDYDCDGLTAAAMLIRHFKKLGADVDHYIPKRFDEGYGLNMQAMESIAKSGCRLLVTVDCGVTAIKEAAHACSLGIDVIITDHHQCLKEIPQCHAVINPKQPGDDYPFKELSGAGIALKLVQALSGADALNDYLDLAAVGTIADIVPLLGENRVIAGRGIQKIREGGNMGLNALLGVAGADPRTADAWHISFAVAPRINACGRMGDPIKALELLIADNLVVCEETAIYLDGENKRRQAEVTAILTQAIQMASACDMVKDRALILCGVGWNQGVVGIVAAILVEKYHRPAILLCQDNGTCTGSGRSIPGVNMFETLERFSDLFTRFGGHEMAGGLTLPTENVPRFIEGYKALLSNYDESIFIPRHVYDLPIHLSQIDTKLVDAMERLQPFGEGNESPVFLLQDAEIRNPGIFGKAGDHLKATIVQKTVSMEGILWRGAAECTRLKSFSKYDMVISPSAEDWNGRKTRCIIQSYKPRISAADLRVSPAAPAQYQDALIAQLIYNADTDSSGAAGRAVQGLGRAQADAFIEKKLKSGIMGTLIIASTQKGSETLIQLIQGLNLTEATDYAFCRLEPNACPYNTVWLAPCNIPDRTGFTDILLYDGCFGMGFIDRLAKSAPDARIWICTEAADIGSMGEQAAKLRLSRETLLQCHNLLKKETGKTKVYRSYAALLERLKNEEQLAMDEMQLRIALKLFSELELMEIHENDGVTLKSLPVRRRRDLLESKIFSALERAEENILKMRRYSAD